MQFQDGSRVKNSTWICFSILPDTHIGTDFRLLGNATGFLCNLILPVVTLYIVLHVVLVIV